VATFRLSRRADADLMNIAAYTLRTWGEEQAAHYIGGLEACFHMLANNPELGRTCDYVRLGLRRIEHGQHVVFYRQEVGGILISRILHQRMLPGRRTIEDEGEEL
jgi:toxin ParE1/3/4